MSDVRATNCKCSVGFVVRHEFSFVVATNFPAALPRMVKAMSECCVKLRDPFDAECRVFCATVWHQPCHIDQLAKLLENSWLTSLGVRNARPVYRFRLSSIRKGGRASGPNRVRPICGMRSAEQASACKAIDRHYKPVRRSREAGRSAACSARRAGTRNASSSFSAYACPAQLSRQAAKSGESTG